MAETHFSLCLFCCCSSLVHICFILRTQNPENYTLLHAHVRTRENDTLQTSITADEERERDIQYFKTDFSNSDNSRILKFIVGFLFISLLIVVVVFFGDSDLSFIFCVFFFGIFRSDEFSSNKSGVVFFVQFRESIPVDRFNGELLQHTLNIFIAI